MIDADQILSRVSRLTPAEAVALCTEMGTVLNSIQVQLRDQGYDLGEPGDPDSLATRLLFGWNHLFQARPLLRALERQHPVAVDAPIWTGSEPPLDEMPPPV